MPKLICSGRGVNSTRISELFITLIEIIASKGLLSGIMILRKRAQKLDLGIRPSHVTLNGKDSALCLTSYSPRKV